MQRDTELAVMAESVTSVKVLPPSVLYRTMPVPDESDKICLISECSLQWIYGLQKSGGAFPSHQSEQKPAYLLPNRSR